MKKPTKRKMYQKRRKKEKAELRRKGSETTPLPEAISASYFKNNNKYYQRNILNYPTSNHKSNPITSYSQGIQRWWQTYCSAIEFHNKQQNAWRDERKKHQMILLEKYANEYETSSEEEDNDEEYEYFNNDTNERKDDENMNNNLVVEDVDEEYLKFLEITHKHREELRLKRSEENI